MSTTITMPANVRAAMGLRAVGLSITSTATPALNGVYMCSGDAWDALQAEADSLTRNNGTFVDGSTSVNWPDKTGTGHTFTVAQFGTLINAIHLFVVQCHQYAAGVVTAIPSGTATIP